MRDVTALAIEPIEASGLSEVVDYTIQADAAMFRILIDGLYSNKPLAIVRELCTNAYDSHAEAGIMDRPFVLQLPTRWDDTFMVRDYGVSLTHEQVQNVITRVGKSTKRDSNISVGKFGLGFKSPFAYTDSFTITVILGGEKRIYNAFMDAGIPRLAMLSQTDTDEEQGVAVSFPVQQKDHHVFTEAAKRVLLGFDRVPKNNIGIEAGSLKPKFEGEGWVIYEAPYNLGISGAYVRQGCVLYPVDRAALTNGRPSDGLEVLSSENLIIDMPVGSVDITPSRESLSYDVTTIDNLLDRMDVVAESLKNGLTEQVTNAPSYYDACESLFNVLSTVNNRALSSHINRCVKWRGRQVSSRIRLGAEKIKMLRRHGVDLATMQYTKRDSRRLDILTHYVPPNAVTELTFFYTTGEHLTYLPARLSAADRGAKGGGATFLRNFKPGSRAELFLRAALGRPTIPFKFINLADVPFQKPESSGNRVVTGLGSYDSSLERFITAKSADFAVADPARAIFYVHTSHGHVLDGTRPYNSSYLHDVWKYLRDVEALPENAVLVSIPSSRKDLARTIPAEWVGFIRYAESALRDLFDPAQLAEGQRYDNLMREGRAGSIPIFEAIAMYASDIKAKDSLFHVFGAQHKIVKALEYNPQVVLKNLLRAVFTPAEEMDLCAVPAGARDLTVEFSKTLRKIRKTYPMIAMLVRQGHGRFAHTDSQLIVEYINMIDEKNNQDRVHDLAWDSFSG